MTDSDKQKIERFRPRLERMLGDLTAQRDATAEDRATVTLDQQSVGRLSRMDAMQAQQMALAADRQRQAQIARIRRALSQMDAGEFGYCVECGNEIPEGRLNADPSVQYCIACASSKG